MSTASAISCKRKRSFQEIYEVDNCYLLPSKRQETEDTNREARRAARDRYWDTLTKVWLTPRALREFDRRNAVQTSAEVHISNSECQSRERVVVETSHLSSASLKGLKRFARRGGPDLIDLRSNMSSLRSGRKRPSKPTITSRTSSTGQTLKSSAYDRDFEQKCLDHGIRMLDDHEPENLHEIQERLARPRTSLFPSNEHFKQFRKIQREARDEDDVISESVPIILGENRRNYPSAANVLFGNMDDMALNVFKKPKPDRFWGAQPSQIDPRVRQELSPQIVPSTNKSYPAAPNLFLEAKGPDGSAAVKTRQACYDGALGARAMHALQNYGQDEPIYDNRASAFSSTYHDGTLKLYSHHPTKASLPDEPVNYHMNLLGAWELTVSDQTFRDGVGALRNARDLAREQRDLLIEQANSVARTPLADSISFDESQSADITSMDESNTQDTVTRGLTNSDISTRASLFSKSPDIARSKRQKRTKE